MRRGFWNGLLTGGIAAMVLTMFMTPQYKKMRRPVMKDSRLVKSGARRVIKGAKKMADDWMK
ncbi:hypothetical protein [Phosphitispora sp. TUW77]|uniref:hypothetical protein n=1 Tax=Phosphitispora sp. TUW77 TaxID=3152361 RepID=UPI003AB49D80